MSLEVRTLISQTRQNHALEHATVHLLCVEHPGLHLMGRSDWEGFSLYGAIDAQAVLRASTTALLRLQQGNTALAVHPRCGTNLAVAGLSTTLAAYCAAAAPLRSRFLRALLVIVALVGASVVARPLGLATQRHIVTSADLGGVRIAGIQQTSQAGVVVHRVLVSRRGVSEGSDSSR